MTKERFDLLYDPDIKKCQYDAIIGEVNKRFGGVVNLISKGKDWFVYDNYDYKSEDDAGEFDPIEYKTEIGIAGDRHLKEPYENCGDRYIPTRWLWTDDADILKEYNTNVTIFERDEEIKKNRIKQKLEELKLKKEEMKRKKPAMILAIKSKLTEEELKFITFK